MSLKYTNQATVHPFHLVDPSPWPFFTAMSVLVVTYSLVLYMHNFNRGGFYLIYGFLFLFLCVYGWWRDVVVEGSFEGRHTLKVQLGLALGMYLFIISEGMFFVSFFWAFFHSSLAPSPDIFSVWPPKGIEPISPWKLPFANTLILLTSGATLTTAHHAIVSGKRDDAILVMIVTVALAFIFTCIQLFEYIHATFTISDGIYGSTFYLGTGFHGFHVIVGTLYIFIGLLRLIEYHFTREHHFGFESAAWYWHFVDAVWLALFLSFYWWGGL